MSSVFRAEIIEQLSLTDLKSAPKNARTHSQAQLQRLADGITRFGFTNPVLIDDQNVILAGHGRVAAAKLAGLERAPCIRIGTMTSAEKRAYAIADNALPLGARWDSDLLTSQTQALVEGGFETNLLGFDPAQFDQLLVARDEASPKREKADPDEAPDPPPPPEVVTRLGDVWVLGRHRLICGDTKDPAVLAALMKGEKADAVFTDPPWNLPIEGHVSGRGRTHHREFVEASGEMSREDFAKFLERSMESIVQVCRPGAILFVCMDWRHIAELINSGEKVGLELKNLIVWVKPNGGLGTFFRSQHELVTAWKLPGAPHTNTFGLGEGGRSRTNVWTYAGANAFKVERAEELAMHPTVKPVLMVTDAIRDVTHRGDIVLDAFGGSGTTLIAAQKVGRLARLVEWDPGYCDVTVRRWEKFTGQAAVLQEGGADFETMGARRRSQAALATAPSPWDAFPMKEN